MIMFFYSLHCITNLTKCSDRVVIATNWSSIKTILNPSQGEELASQFTQMTLSRQGSSENPEPPPMYQASPTVLSQHPPPQTSYIMATTGQPLQPPSGYQTATGHPHPPPPPPPPSQPVIQAPPPPQGYIQPPPPQQVCCSWQIVKWRYQMDSNSAFKWFFPSALCS